MDRSRSVFTLSFSGWRLALGGGLLSMSCGYIVLGLMNEPLATRAFPAILSVSVIVGLVAWRFLR